MSRFSHHGPWIQTSLPWLPRLLTFQHQALLVHVRLTRFTDVGRGYCSKPTCKNGEGTQVVPFVCNWNGHSEFKGTPTHAHMKWHYVIWVCLNIGPKKSRWIIIIIIIFPSTTFLNGHRTGTYKFSDTPLQTKQMRLPVPLQHAPEVVCGLFGRTIVALQKPQGSIGERSKWEFQKAFDGLKFVRYK